MEVASVVGWVALGIGLLVLVLDSALRTVILPRGVAPILTRLVFVVVRGGFDAWARATRSYEARDSVMALYGPVGLLVLPFFWLLMTLGAFTSLFHALGIRGFDQAFEMSGSSLFTLGTAHPPDLPTTALAYVEAASGLTLLALLIAYLPTIYAAFSRREVLVAQLAVRGGEPPSGVEILTRAHRMVGFELLPELWVAWQQWFAELEETHTSIGILSFFRSPLGHRSWVTASAAVLDAASLRLSIIDLPFDPHAGLCVRGGFFSLRAVCAYFHIPFDPDPLPTDPISITRDEFLEACDQLADAGIRLKDDREQGWRDFQGWRVNYDRPVIGLAGMVMAPYAPWSSDRSLRYRRPPLRWRG